MAWSFKLLVLDKSLTKS